MGESERTPHISLEIDQEIFIDAVEERDVIEGATVATEVTSFDRVGDAYVLEGAILFAGYMNRNQDTVGVDDESFFDALSVADGLQKTGHLHHRVPFVLRVPVKAQARGIVNVASRISDWKLEVISAGWIRILGDLTIVGLNGTQGYHFQCGAQEEGDLFFSEQVESIRVEAPPRFEEVQDEERYESVSDLTDSVVAASHDDETDREVDFAADFRGDGEGQEVDFTSSRNENEEVAANDGPDAADASAQDDLRRLDQFFDDGSRSGPAIAEFEFEEQVSDLDAPQPAPEPSIEAGSTVPFRISTAFTEAPGTDFGENEKGVQGEDSKEARTTGADEAEDGVATATVGTSDSLSIRDRMWSFVDFDGPERTFTLRYVIVEREASVDDLADYYGCAKSELMRVNRISAETVLHPGQSVAIPVGR